MKILFFNANIGYDGASKMMAAVANYLALHNHDVTFLTYENSEIYQPLHKCVRHKQIMLQKLIIKGIRRIDQVFILHKHIKQNKYDIALAFLSPPKYLLTLACKFTNTRVLISERGDPYIRLPGSKIFVSNALKYVVNTANAFVFQTKGAQSYYPKKVISKSIIIPNPVVNRNILKQYQGEREKAIVNVARFDIFQKRQDLLIKAFSKILNKYPEYKLKLYGDGPDEYILRKLTGELNITDKVLFMGVSHDVYKDIRKAALFVLSSDFEGIPNALLEAMSVGLPCISTDCSPGGARLLIRNKENGMLVPPDDLDEMAEAIEYMLSHTIETAKMAKNALNVVSEYTEDKIYSEWESFINDICKKQ